MKICDIVQSYTHTSGGIKTYIDAKRRHVETCDGFQHVLIKPGPRDSVVRDGNLTTYEIAARFIPGYKPYRFNYRIDKVLRVLAREEPDVVEVASPYVMPWAAFIHRRRRPDCAVVGYYHADYPRAYVGRVARRLYGARAARLAERVADAHARRIYGGCDLTVTAARIFATKLAGLGVDNILELPLGVDLQTFCPSRRDPALRARLEIPTDSPLLIYSGRIDAEKRADILGDALRLLPRHLQVHLLVMGAGPLRAEFEARAAAGEPVTVLPYESDRERVASLMASADLYVTAGPHETFGLSVVEAQACGLPVVGVRAGGLIERVTPALGELARPDDPLDFAAAITRCLARDPRELGRRARAHVVGSYAWDQIFDQLIQAYRDLLAGKQAASGRRRTSRLLQICKSLSDQVDGTGP